MNKLDCERFAGSFLLFFVLFLFFCCSFTALILYSIMISHFQNPDKQAAEAFQILSNSFDILGDPVSLKLPH